MQSVTWTKNGGKAEQDDGHKFLEVQPQVLPAEMQNRAFAEEEGEDPDGTDGLAANRGERRAFAAHIEAVDEYRIEVMLRAAPMRTVFMLVLQSPGRKYSRFRPSESCTAGVPTGRAKNSRLHTRWSVRLPRT